MERVAELAEFFKIPAMVCVNKFDINPEQGVSIEASAMKRGLSVIGRIPFDPIFTKAMVQGKPVFEYDGKSEAAQAVRELWSTVEEKLGIVGHSRA
jgi:MinD superfamily P-loop ATPase